MTEALKGKKLEEARRLFGTFQRLVRGEGQDENGAGLGKLAVFTGVSKFPMRVKCATLAWHTVLAAMEKKNETVTTE
jgi:nitrogen fixation NifU-like protein